jgi:F-type H+-transporting ATPase subunit a
MCGDLFSSFDFFVSGFFGLGRFAIFFLVLFVCSAFFLSLFPFGRFYVFSGLISYLVRSLCRRVVLSVTGVASVGSVLFLFLLCANFGGLVPYVFSSTRHVALTFSLGLVVWLSVIVSCVTLDSYSLVVHMCPYGAPLVLGWFLSLVEVVSICLRPITLSVRLAANMSAGHVVLGLVGGSAALCGFSTLGLVVAGFLYLLFEVGVCFIQAFVFYLLTILYFDEHS